MSGILLHDGRRTGHLGWCSDWIRDGSADGVVISPFATPRITVPRNPSGREVASTIRDCGGEVLFDPGTHARLLPGTNKLDFYDEWELWGNSGVGLATEAQRREHVERVFDQQSELGVPLLAPTITLDSPDGAEAINVLETAVTARGLDQESWQSLVGRRTFWRSGHRLDAFVGQLATLRAPTWVITVANDIVLDHVPDLSDVEAFAGLYRTVHSLSRRSRVILLHADFSGLPAVAAGADTLGSGWDRAMRTFDPLSFRLKSDDGPRIPASYVTQGQLSAVLRRDAGQEIERWDPTAAYAIRGGPMPPSDKAERLHHLRQLRQLVLQIDGKSTRKERVGTLRAHYEQAMALFDTLLSSLPGRSIRAADRTAWVEQPSRALQAYAEAENLW